MKINEATFLSAKTVVDGISERQNYPNNIKRLLYVIIPAFIEKYGLSEEKTIYSVFEDIPILIKENRSNQTVAQFSRRISFKNDDFRIVKEVILNRYAAIAVIDLMDSIIHEYNHALNSVKNELTEKDSKLYIRTGISHLITERKDIEITTIDDENRALEELLNTKQTESIIEIIKTFSSFHFSDSSLETSIAYIEAQIPSNYVSKAYLLQTTICKPLLDNRSFMPTLENLRYNGYIEDIPKWFDEVTGEEGSFQKLSKLLDKSLKLETEYNQTKFFKRNKIKKVKTLVQEMNRIIKLYDSSSIYK